MSNRKALQICVCVLMIVSVHPYTVAQQRGVDVQPGSAAPRSLLASLHMPASPSQSLAWKRVLPEGSDALDGPVLFALVIRSSATPGSIPKIANNFTLSNSLLTDNGSQVAIGSLSISSSGVITFTNGQTFPGTGTITGVTAGTGLTGGGTSGSVSLGIANGGVTTAQIGSGAAINGQILTANGSGGAGWQTLTLSGWSLNGNAGASCTTTPCSSFLGTTDSSNLEMRVNAQRAYRIESAMNNAIGGVSPNVIGGFSDNVVISGVGGATIGGGGANFGGGNQFNRVTDDFGTVAGGALNRAGNNAGTTSDAAFATVGGGYQNTASNTYSTVGGGFSNTASGDKSTVAGGDSNVASAQRATVGGGFAHTASGAYSTVGGGYNSTATAVFATVAGGLSNNASNFESTVCGGHSNTASGGDAFVGGGFVNTASGLYSMVPGGFSNTSSGPYSFAAGQHANTNSHQGAFVWGDNSTTTDVTATSDNQFVARTSGGAAFYSSSDLSTGVTLAAGGGAWSTVSDRNVKEHFATVNNQQLLTLVLALPITTWNYKTQATGIRHIGPMAQDFYTAFQVGEDDKHITTIDENGVALAAIQGLNQKLEENVRQLRELLQKKEAEIAAQQQQIEHLRQQTNDLLEWLRHRDESRVAASQ